MYDYKTIVSNDLLTAEFNQLSNTEMSVELADNTTASIFINEEGLASSDNEEAMNQYRMWSSRPERVVGRLANIEGKSLGQLMDIYERLLVGAYLLRFPETEIDPNDAPYARMIDWLRSTDFYRAPASTQYHESIVGGLLIHSLKVYNEAMILNRLPKFRNVSPCQAALVALCHDWCKIDTYESYTKNVKNEGTGQWEKVDAFRRNFTGLTLGHGVTSMVFAMKYMDLSEEECAAIRWHMGRWNVTDPEINELQKCNEQYPLVHLLQFADQLSIVTY